LFEVSDLKEKFKNFNWQKLSKVRGKAHEGIIGAWIDLWIEIDPENHMVLNPASYIADSSADVVFLRNIQEEGSRILPLYYPIGVAEVENSPKKWIEKVETLRAYEKEYLNLRAEGARATLKSLLLSITAKEVYQEKFEELVQRVKDLSKNSESSWVLYRLTIASWRNDTCPIVREGDLVMWRESISDGEFFIVDRGEVAT